MTRLLRKVLESELESRVLELFTTLVHIYHNSTSTDTSY